MVEVYETLPIVPLREVVVFPHMMMPFVIGRPSSTRALEHALLKDKRLIQGSIRWPEHFGITSGLLAGWWKDMLLSQEGEDHARLRRLANPAFSPRILEALTPDFTALANELVDAFSERGSCEYISEFSEPYAARVICRLMSMPESMWERITELSTEIGLAFSVDIANQLPRIEAALQGLIDISVDVIESKKSSTDDDFITNLVRANVEGDALTYDELLNMVSLLIFGGFDTTRNQLGLAMQTFAEHQDQWRLLSEQPGLGRAAVEEVMRVNPTTTWVTREAIDGPAKGEYLVLRRKVAGQLTRDLLTQADEIYSRHEGEGHPLLWRRATAAEQWIATTVAPPDFPAMVCYSTSEPPVLDGVAAPVPSKALTSVA